MFRLYLGVCSCHGTTNQPRPAGRYQRGICDRLADENGSGRADADRPQSRLRFSRLCQRQVAPHPSEDVDSAIDDAYWRNALRCQPRDERWQPELERNGEEDRSACFDYLFALTSDGRRWFVPSAILEARSSITLGGPKYSEFEIEAGEPIADLVYASDGSIESPSVAGEYPSGQRTATVNRQAQPSQVRILPPPFRSRPGFPTSKYERSRGQRGEAVINQKRRVTIPRTACAEAGLQEDDRLNVRSEGDGRVVLERIEPPPAALASVA
jgi:hypothetical protein